MTRCIACQDAPGTEVPGTVGGLTVPMLCGECRTAAVRAEVMGREYELPEDREEFLQHRASVLDGGVGQDA